MAQQSGQKTFSSPDEASNALFVATRNNDEKVMLAILGPDEKQIVSSGDDTEDSNNRAIFVKKYEEMHRLLREPDGTVTLYIGAEKLAYANPTGGQRERVVFRHGCGQERNFVPAHRAQ
jgi:hypothetical protein